MTLTIKEFNRNKFQSKLIPLFFDVTEQTKQKFYKCDDWETIKADLAKYVSLSCVMTINNKRCGYTEDIEIDHITAISLDPTRVLDIRNLQPLCSDCHKKYKHQLDRTDYIKHCRNNFAIDCNNPKLQSKWQILHNKHRQYFPRTRSIYVVINNQLTVKATISYLWKMSGLLAENVINDETNHFRKLIAKHDYTDIVRQPTKLKIVKPNPFLRVNAEPIVAE
jgi:hypothetical protein